MAQKKSDNSLKLLAATFVAAAGLTYFHAFHESEYEMPVKVADVETQACIDDPETECIESVTFRKLEGLKLSIDFEGNERALDENGAARFTRGAEFTLQYSGTGSDKFGCLTPITSGLANAFDDLSAVFDDPSILWDDSCYDKRETKPFTGDLRALTLVEP